MQVLPTKIESKRPLASAASDLLACRDEVGFEAEKGLQCWPIKILRTGEHLYTVHCPPFLGFRSLLYHTVLYHILRHSTMHCASAVGLARMLDQYMGLRGARCLHPGYS